MACLILWGVAAARSLDALTVRTGSRVGDIGTCPAITTSRDVKIMDQGGTVESLWTAAFRHLRVGLSLDSQYHKVSHFSQSGSLLVHIGLDVVPWGSLLCRCKLTLTGVQCTDCPRDYEAPLLASEAVEHTR